jgi:hypothetical protein
VLTLNEDLVLAVLGVKVRRVVVVVEDPDDDAVGRSPGKSIEGSADSEGLEPGFHKW